MVRTCRAAPAAEHAGHPPADFLAVAVVVTATQGLADTIVTHLVHQAGLVIETNIFAELSVAHLALGALGVGRTCLGLLHTADHRGGVGDEGEGAGALGAVVHHLALGVGATGIASAGVGAAVVDAGVGLGTVGVCPAPHDTHLVETYVTQETVIVNPTCHCKYKILKRKSVCQHGES